MKFSQDWSNLCSLTVQYNEDDNPRKLVLSIVSSKRVHFDLSFFLVEHVRQTLYIRAVGTCQGPKGRNFKESNFCDIWDKVRERGSCPPGPCPTGSNSPIHSATDPQLPRKTIPADNIDIYIYILYYDIPPNFLGTDKSSTKASKAK